MKVEIETEDRHKCTPFEYKDTKKNFFKIHTSRSNKSPSEERKRSEVHFDKCEYKYSKKDTQEPYRRDSYKTKHRRNLTDTSMHVPKRVL